jgi:tRNA A37 N6-isopentenylltransferase MiaA
MMYSDVVMEKAEGEEPADGMGIRLHLEMLLNDLKNDQAYDADTEITTDEMKALCEKFKTKIKEKLGKPFPDDPMAQLMGSIGAVFKSWNGKRAVSYRRIEHIPDNWGTDQHKPAIITLTMPRHQLHIRICDRVKQMFAQGLPEEVRNLKSTYSNWSATAAKAIGYQETLAMLDGRLTQADAIERITIRTRQLAKRQETWFRHQQNSIWCEIEITDCIEEIARKVLFLWDKYGKTELKI